MTELITGGKPQFFHCKLSVNAAMQAVYFLKLGDKEQALDMLESAYLHADNCETRPDGEKFAPCWLSELDDKREYIHFSSPGTVYDSVYDIIAKPENQFCEIFKGNKRFEKLMDKLKEKTGK